MSSRIAWVEIDGLPHFDLGLSYGEKGMFQEALPPHHLSDGQILSNLWGPPHLIHLMRDINDDLLKQPFNDEMKDIARAFADLLRPIVDSIDRYGLKARHLRKHHAAVDRFYTRLEGSDLKTELATGYQRRFKKNRDRLFTFLDRDGVPWNNNNAEHAIKAFVRLRNVIRGTSSVKGIREYLILLSVAETSKCKGVSVLDFFRSQRTDVDDFIARPTASLVPRLADSDTGDLSA
jgi:hypothetical protein